MMKKTVGLFSVLGVLLLAGPALAQLNTTFRQVFGYFLAPGGKIQLSGAFHAGHYRTASDQIAADLRPALNSLIASNVSSFPLSSTIAGIKFDGSSGLPVPIMGNLGPIFAENAQTLGQGNFNLGINYTYLNLAKFRGLPTKDIRFSFTHDDVVGPNNPPPPSLGDPQYENDVIDVYLGLDADASISVLSATYGLTNKLDIGVAVPVVHVSLNGNAKAIITSYSYGRVVPGRPDFEGAAHRFGGTLLNPILEADTLYSASATNVGDVAVRLKYNFLRSAGAGFATLVDIRLPTGNKDDYMGTGEVSVKVAGILSKKINDFSPHLNVAYDSRRAGLDSDELEVIAGFDQRIANGVTVAAEVFGVFDLQKDQAIKLFPGTVTTYDQYTNTLGSGRLNRVVDRSNIDDRSNDNTFDLALGFRAAPSERLQLFGNIIVPMNDSGLRSSVAPTIGVNVNF